LLEGRLGDPFRTGAIVGALVAVAGFATLLFTAARMRGATLVPQQVPYVVSGGLTALGLIVFGLVTCILMASRAAIEDRTADLAHLAETLESLGVHHDDPSRHRS
jgi:hypothetical protein